jgi:GNAT superfamily N-acetyltransferase
MIDQISVRPAAPEDAAPLAAIWLETAEMLAAGDPRFKPANDGPAQWLIYFLEQVHQPDRAFFTAIRRGKPSGFLAIAIQANPGYATNRVGVVLDLCVDSHGRGGSTGAKLWEAGSAWFREQGIARVEIRVPASHAIAQAFWRATGARAWYDLLTIKL